MRKILHIGAQLVIWFLVLSLMQFSTHLLNSLHAKYRPQCSCSLSLFTDLNVLLQGREQSRGERGFWEHLWEQNLQILLQQCFRAAHVHSAANGYGYSPSAWPEYIKLILTARQCLTVPSDGNLTYWPKTHQKRQFLSWLCGLKYREERILQTP